MAKELAVVNPDLEQSPGWQALNKEKHDWLAQKTFNILQYRRMEGLGAVGACIELAEVERGLEGEKLTMTDYIRTVFGQSERTARRRLKDYKELREHWPEKLIEAVATKGATLLRGASGIGLRDLLNVARELPPPKSNEAKVIEGYVMKDVREKIRSQRKGRNRVVRLSEEGAAKVALNTLLRLMRGMALDGAPAKRKWLTRVVGWTMDAQALSGTLHITRLSVPGGLIIKRGRPRKRPQTLEA